MKSNNDVDWARHYTCLSHSPRECWEPTEEEALMPLGSGRLYAPLATIKKLAELRGANGNYHEALQALNELPEQERERYPYSDKAIEWVGVPKAEWRLLTYGYREPTDIYPPEIQEVIGYPLL